MRILDKTISKAPWALLTPEQRDRLTNAGDIAPWMFQQAVILTVVDEDGQVQQFDGTVQPIGEVELSVETAETVKPTLGERLRALFTKEEAD